MCRQSTYNFKKIGRYSKSNKTYEKEKLREITALYVLVIKTWISKIESDIGRKETSTSWSTSHHLHHFQQHKMASVNFLVHHLNQITFHTTKVLKRKHDYKRNKDE